MSVFDKFLSAIKLNDDYDDDYLDDELDDDMDNDDYLEEEEKPKKSFLSKFSRKNNDLEDDDLDDLDDLDELEDDSKKKEKTSLKSSSVSSGMPKVEKTAHTGSPKITPMRSKSKVSGNGTMSVCVIKPSSMEDTREIADTLVDNSTVILNLEGIDMELAQRIIDFTSGACYSLGGSLQKISSYIFVLAPYNVDIKGDLQSILGGSTPYVRAGY